MKQNRQNKKHRNNEKENGSTTLADLIAFLAVLVATVLLILVGDTPPEALSSYMMACGAAIFGWRRISRR